MKLRYLSMNQLAELTGLDRATVKKRLVDVQPHEVKAKAMIYDTHIALPVLLADENTRKDTNKKLLDEQLRYEKARTEKIMLENERTRGELVHITDIARVVSDEYTRVRARLLSIPSRCAMDLALEMNPAKVKNRLDEEVGDALSELTADEKYEEINDVGNTEADSNSDTTENAEGATEIKSS